MNDQDAVDRANSDEQDETPASQLCEAKSLSSEAGWQWIVEGFEIFKLQPGLWIIMVIVVGIIMLISSMIPFLGAILAPILAPIFTGGFMYICDLNDQKKKVSFGDLFKGFNKQTGPLVVIGLINTAAVFIIGFIAIAITGIGTGVGALTGFGVSVSGDGGMGLGVILGFLLGLLVSSLLYIPVLMAMWFAPVLVFFHEDLKPIDALKKSFQAMMKNMMPFLVFGLVSMLMFLVAAVPLGLGLLVAVPVLIGANFKSYQQLFLD